MAIPQIAALAGDVASIRRVLADQISAELREGLATGRTPRTNVAHACAVLNHLEPQVKSTQTLQYFFSTKGAL